ncbi:MAG: hypothetical protein HQL64_07620 [Magnetococcales bacterium]|nr:hypothetical protein [Magnetococcales bacterium]
MARDDDDTRTRTGPADKEAPAPGDKGAEAPPKGNKLLLPLIGAGVAVAALGAYFLLAPKKVVEPPPSRADLFNKARLLIDDRVQDNLQAESQSRVLGQTSPLLLSPGEKPASRATGHAEGTTAETSRAAEPAPKESHEPAPKESHPIETEKIAPIAHVPAGSHP